MNTTETIVWLTELLTRVEAEQTKYPNRGDERLALELLHSEVYRARNTFRIAEDRQNTQGGTS
jgi:hypothetical protein